MDKVGPICRGVEDCAVVFDAIHGPDGKDWAVVDVPFTWEPRRELPGLRVGYVSAEFDAVEDPAEKAVYEAALKKLTESHRAESNMITGNL